MWQSIPQWNVTKYTCSNGEEWWMVKNGDFYIGETNQLNPLKYENIAL